MAAERCSIEIGLLENECSVKLLLESIKTRPKTRKINKLPFEEL